MTELRWLGIGDDEAVLAAGHLFDDAPTPAWTADFLSRPGHHLCVAYVDGEPAGFVSGAEICHPDKGVEMCLYELGVDEGFRRRGIGKALTTALAQRAQELGCTGMWVLTSVDNEQARPTYASAGGQEAGEHLMVEWRF